MNETVARSIRTNWPILVALAIGLVLAATQLSASYWIDELYTVEHYAQLDGILIDPHPPLYPLFIAGWSALFGTSELALRSLSIIFWLAAAYVVSRKSRVAAAMVLVSPVVIEAAANARMYAMLTFAASLIGVGLNDAIRGETRGRRMLLIGTIIASGTHVYGAILSGVAYGVLTLSERRMRWEPFAWIVPVGAWYAFQWFFVETTRIGWLEVTIDTVRAIGTPFGASIAWLSLLWIGIIAYAVRPKGWRIGPTRGLLLLSFGTLAAALIITFTVQPILHPRYVAALVPVTGLLIGRINDSKRAALIAIVVLLALTPLSDTTVYAQDYRSIGSLVQASENPSVISFARQQGYYTNGSIVCEHEDCVRNHIRGYDTVWTIDGVGSMPETMLSPLDGWNETRYDVEHIDVRSYTR